MITVYRYNAEKTSDFNEAAMGQLKLAHELRNRFVELDHEIEKEMQAIWAAHPVLRDASADLEAKAKLVEEARSALGEVKRATKKVDPELALTLKAARALHREAKLLYRERRELARSTVKPQLRELEDKRRARKKELYAEFCTQKGLYWSTYNDVSDKFETSRKQIIAKRTKGMPAELKFHRWTGEGTLTVQLQRREEDPPREPGFLSVSRWRNMLSVPHIPNDTWESMSRTERKNWARERTPGQDRNLGRVFRMRVGTKDGTPAWLHLRMCWHRPLPDNADICFVQVTRRMVVGKPRITVAVTMKIDDVDLQPEAPVAALNLGWRSVDHGIRVAAFASMVPLAEPPPLSWIIKLSATEAELVIPNKVLNAFHRSEKIDSLRSNLILTLRAYLSEHAHLLPVHEEHDYSTIGQWASPGRFAALAIRWRDEERTPEQEELYGVLEAWRKQDKHLWHMTEGQTRRKIADRRQQYKIAAKWILDQCPRVLLTDIEIAELARTPDISQDDTVQAKLARWQRTVAASGEFKLMLLNKERTSGTMVDLANPAYVSTYHLNCGGELTNESRKESLYVLCETCGQWVDQDLNAAWHLLEAASDPRVFTKGGKRREERLTAGSTPA